jgi:hypothetical protein
MGLFNFLGKAVTLPIKIGSTPFKSLEAMVVRDPDFQIFTPMMKELTDTIEYAFDSFEKDKPKEP